MNALFSDGGYRFSILLLLAAGLGFFAASRAAADALTHNPHPHPGRLALGHWIPIACASVTALFLGVPEVALTILFATSVAALSLVLGVMSYVTPMMSPPGDGRAIWPFVLPAAVLALIAGLSGRIAYTHAGAMLILGLVLLPMARSRPAHPSVLPLDYSRALAAVQLVLAILLALVAGWAAVKGAQQIHDRTRVVSAGISAAAVIAPMLMFPVIASSGTLAYRGQSSAALTMQVQVVLLNLCALLPALALLWYLRPMLLPTSPLWRTLSWSSIEANPAIVYPILLWRLDTVMLVVLGVMLLPVSMGRWMLGRYEAMGLIIGYAMYLMLVVVMGLR